MIPGRIRIAVLDDDPTGIQTVHGCMVCTRWDAETLRAAFEDDVRFFYVLTNTRARTQAQARQTVADAVESILDANRAYGDNLLFVSRSDSTLRSHFPTEINAILGLLERERGRSVDAVFLVPAFFEGGRLTVDDVHYLLDGDRRIPTAESEFAKDSVFGYRSSHLPSYIEEKTQGAVRAADVLSVPLTMLRSGDMQPLRRLLGSLHGGSYVTVNAEVYADLNVFAQVVLDQVEAGKRFVFQSAASVVKALAGLPDRALLDAGIVEQPGHGLFVVGSHVRKSTRQLERLLAVPQTEGFELDVCRILEESDALRADALAGISAAWSRGATPVVYTSRAELKFADKDERLAAGRQISRFLVALVRDAPGPLSFLVAKGGITSHDILVDGLQVGRSRVLGQIQPGVPVVKTPGNSRFPNMPYVIFPGNVGDEDALARLLATLAAAGAPG